MSGSSHTIYAPITFPLISCECGMAYILIAVVCDDENNTTTMEQSQSYYCPYCGKDNKL